MAGNLHDWQLFIAQLNAAALVPHPEYAEIMTLTGLNNNVIARETRTAVQLSSYPLIVSNHQYAVFQPNVRQSIIIGHPGIGKSSSAIFLLKHALQNNTPFVYSSGDNSDTYYGWFPAGEGPQLCTASSAWVTDPNVIWFMNQREHGPFGAASCRMVLICSPDKQNFKHFEKQFRNILFLYMPLPTEAEVLAIARVNNDEFPDVLTPQVVRNRMEIVGRVPRKVCRIQFDLEDEGINEALHNCSYELDIFQSHVLVSATDCSHRIFAFNADPVTLTRTQTTFLSDEIQRRYMAAWKNRNFHRFRSFLASNNNNTDLGTQYGKAFEEHIHAVLAAGGTFNSRVVERLGGEVPVRINVRTVPFAQRTTTRIANNASFEDVHQAHYLKPLSGNFPAVDSLVMHSAARCTDLYQVTVDRTHGINGARLEELLVRLDAQVANAQTRTYRFIFVVPNYLFRTFPRQAISDGLSAAHRARLEQWVIGVGVGMEDTAVNTA